MGVSTDAILCYGFRLKNSEGEEESINIEWLLGDAGEMMMFEDFLAKVSGLAKPDGDYDGEKYRTDPEYNKSWGDYWAKKGKLEKEFGVTLVRHCRTNFPMHILAAEASVKTAARGEPWELGQSIAAQSEWRGKLRSFCERAGIPFEEPQFILCSDWS